MDARHAGDRCQLLHDQSLQFLSIAHGDLEQVVVLAGDVVALQHFWNLLDRRAEVVDLLDLVQLQRNLDEAEHVEAEPLAVEERHIAADEALFLQPADARVHRGRRKIQPPRQFGVGDARVGLQFAQKAPVEFVECHW